MSKTSFLKTELEKELNHRGRFSEMSMTEIPLEEKQSVHVYNGQGNYTAEQIGEIIFAFNNESAWLWNKTIELELTIGSKDGELKTISLGDNLIYDGDSVTLKSNGDNKFLIENIKTRSTITVGLNNGDIISWKFNVLNKNSIDLKIFYRIDYLKILKVTLDRNVENEKVELLSKEIQQKNEKITDLEKEVDEHKLKVSNLDLDFNQLKIQSINQNNVIKMREKTIEKLNNGLTEYGNKYDMLKTKSIKDNSMIQALKVERENCVKSMNCKIEELRTKLKDEVSEKNRIIDEDKKNFVTILDSERNTHRRKTEKFEERVSKLEDELVKEKTKTLNYHKCLSEAEENHESSVIQINRLENLCKKKDAKIQTMNVLLKTNNKKIEELNNKNGKLVDLCDENDRLLKIKDEANKKAKEEITENIKILNNEFETIMERYNELVETNKKLIEQNKTLVEDNIHMEITRKNKRVNKFGFDLNEFNRTYGDVVVKRHIFILEKKINKVVKNMKIHQKLVQELSEENKRLVKINHINKYNEKKLKNSLDKAKMKINREVNTNRAFEQKIKLIKDSFIKDLKKGKRDFDKKYR